MTEQTVPALVTRVLRAIDDDDASYYRELLQTLLDAPEALRVLSADTALCASLMTELRKLRPLGLWARGPVGDVLAAKRAFILDGGLCQTATCEPVPAPSGRECWLEVPAGDAEARLSQLGPGWGMLVTGDTNDALLAALRRTAPLRALGICLAAPLTVVPSVRLDLVLHIDAPREDAAVSAIPGARVLWTGLSPEAHGVLAASGQNAGLVCEARDALRWALRLAMTRAPRS